MDKKLANKKIGIITVHKNINYGANLQAFASCKYLGLLGYDCSVLDYTLPEHEKSNHIFSWLKQSYDGVNNKSLIYKIKLFISLALSMGWKRKRLKSFSKFRKNNIKLTKQLNDKNDIEKLNLDAIVCGSDQIWNPDIIGSINPIFFGDIRGVRNKISYAASVGKEKYSDTDELIAKELIQKLDYVSVREEDSAKYLSQISGKEIKTVCDPVFLLDRSEYDKVLSKRKIKGDYVLLYKVARDDDLFRTAKDYADRNGLELVQIGAHKGAKHKQIVTYGPSEFLTAIKYAKTVFTNSFHGTAFSIIFEKDFYVYNNKARGSRITNILDKAGLKERLISGKVTSNFIPIDYKVVRDNLKDYVDFSKEFLKNAISSEKEYLACKDCVSCGACVNVCKFDAIRLVEDKKGFLTSVIDKSKCTNCGLCKKVCPAINGTDKNPECESVYAFKGEDELRRKSASGGAFSAIAASVLNNGGVVYGASMRDFKVSHIRCETVEDLSLIQGTKYIPSDIQKCYKLIESDLKNDKTVLFSGTPCQVDGVKHFAKLKKLPLDKLYTIDIICHGVPSPRIFNSYIGWLEKEYKSKVKSFYFRSKKISWRGSSCYAVLENGKELKNGKKLCGFMNLYYSDNITRDSCYSCPYTSKQRVGDITVSDYWGIENLDKSFEDALGVSMVVINSEKGSRLFDSVSGTKIIATLGTAKQPQLSNPTKKPQTHDEFWAEYESKGVDFVLNKYGAVKESFKAKLYKLKKKLLK